MKIGHSNNSRETDDCEQLNRRQWTQFSLLRIGVGTLVAAGVSAGGRRLYVQSKLKDVHIYWKNIKNQPAGSFVTLNLRHMKKILVEAGLGIQDFIDKDEYISVMRRHADFQLNEIERYERRRFGAVSNLAPLLEICRYADHGNVSAEELTDRADLKKMVCDTVQANWTRILRYEGYFSRTAQSYELASLIESLVGRVMMLEEACDLIDADRRRLGVTPGAIKKILEPAGFYCLENALVMSNYGVEYDMWFSAASAVYRQLGKKIDIDELCRQPNITPARKKVIEESVQPLCQNIANKILIELEDYNSLPQQEARYLRSALNDTCMIFDVCPQLGYFLKSPRLQKTFVELVEESGLEEFQKEQVLSGKEITLGY